MKENYLLKTIDVDEMYRIILACQRQGYRLVSISATATDNGAELMYSVAKGYQLENYKIIVNDEEEINSISDIFPSAALFENEIEELFGVKIDSINMDFKGKFYRITEKTPFKRTKDIKVVPPKADAKENIKKEEE